MEGIQQVETGDKPFLGLDELLPTGHLPPYTIERDIPQISDRRIISLSEAEIMAGREEVERMLSLRDRHTAPEEIELPEVIAISADGEADLEEDFDLDDLETPEDELESWDVTYEDDDDEWLELSAEEVTSLDDEECLEDSLEGFLFGEGQEDEDGVST